MGGDGESPDKGEWFFDRPFTPGEVDRLADAVADWLCSDHLRRLVEHVPGRRERDGAVERLSWPTELDYQPRMGVAGRDRLARIVAALGEICEWSRPGTAWDYRVNGGERLPDDEPPPQPGLPVAAVAEAAAALGLRSPGRLNGAPRTLVVLGGRRLAPLNRARAAALAIRAESLTGVRVVLLCAPRALDRRERLSPEVRAYAPGAREEADLMTAAASRVFGAGSLVEEVSLVKAPAADGADRASTYDTLRVLAEDLADEREPVALFTSPTCRPFQCLDAVRALGLGDDGLALELVAHPPVWAADPGSGAAPPHVYLQEIRSTVQAAGRLAGAITPVPSPSAALA